MRGSSARQLRQYGQDLPLLLRQLCQHRIRARACARSCSSAGPTSACDCRLQTRIHRVLRRRGGGWRRAGWQGGGVGGNWRRLVGVCGRRCCHDRLLAARPAWPLLALVVGGAWRVAARLGGLGGVAGGGRGRLAPIRVFACRRLRVVVTHGARTDSCWHSFARCVATRCAGSWRRRVVGATRVAATWGGGLCKARQRSNNVGTRDGGGGRCQRPLVVSLPAIVILLQQVGHKPQRRQACFGRVGGWGSCVCVGV